MTAPSTFAFADVWEMAADSVPDRVALVVVASQRAGPAVFAAGAGRRTYRQLEERANRLAGHLREVGVGRGDHVAVYLENRPEYVETMLAAFKIRAVPINVNHRYVADELAYLLDNSDAVAVVHEPHFRDRLEQVRPGLDRLRTTLECGDAYEAALSASSPERPEVDRSNDDRYVLYTGGTTGRPKGVVWRQEDAFFACLGGGDLLRLAGPVSSPAELPERIVESFVAFPVAPLMHAAGGWVTLSTMFAGGTSVLPRGPLDPELVWQTVDDEGANVITMVGDAVGRPLMDAWDAHPGRWHARSLLSLSNGGAPMSPVLKERIARTFPDKVLVDGFGSSEAGVQGSARQSAEEVRTVGGLTRFASPDGTTVVLGDDDEPLAPGDGRTGRVAKRGRLPLGYHNDPQRTADTFVHIGGSRWLITGDLARVAADGSIELLGRDSATINTGGEKVHGEEVEAVLRNHEGVADVVVVGVPDQRWGSAVCAVVAPMADVEALTLAELVEVCRERLAGYKHPRRLVLVDSIERSPAGKADLRWARQVAADATRR